MENNNIKRTKLKRNKLEMVNLMLPQCGQAGIAPVLSFSSKFLWIHWCLPVAKTARFGSPGFSCGKYSFGLVRAKIPLPGNLGGVGEVYWWDLSFFPFPIS